MKDVSRIIEEYGSKLNEFKSPLSKDWETVLFKAIDILHNLQSEFGLETNDIKKKLLVLITEEKCKEEVINEAITKTRELFENQEDKFIKEALREALELLFAVKISLKSKAKFDIF